MGKKYCTVGKKWCKLSQKGVCKYSNMEIEAIDECPRIAEIKTTTLYTLIREVKFENVFERLCYYFPSQRKSKNGYEAAFNAILKKKQKKHRLNDLFINIEIEKDGDKEYLDIYGISIFRHDIRYGIEFCKWSTWLTMFITNDTIYSLSNEDIVAGCLYEMTFFGFSEKDIHEEKNKMINGLKESVKKNKQNGKN